jgi:hypothetical protein
MNIFTDGDKIINDLMLELKTQNHYLEQIALLLRDQNAKLDQVKQDA